MRNFLIILVVAGAAYVAFSAYKMRQVPAPTPKVAEIIHPEPAPPRPVAPPVQQAPTPAPGPETLPAGFHSKIEITDASLKDGKHVAPIATFYVLTRFSSETKDGVRAVVPGDCVKLLKRMGNGSLRVTDGKAEFMLKETEVTNDLDLARAAELKLFKEHVLKP